MRREEEIHVFEDFKRDAARLHPGFKEHTSFVSQRLKIRATQAGKDQLLLKELQDGLLATLRSPDVDTELKIRAQGSGWDEILDLYMQYVNKSDESKSKNNVVWGLARRGDKVAGTAAGLVKLIPAENGLSILKEGLAYVLLVSFQAHFERIDR